MLKHGGKQGRPSAAKPAQRRKLKERPPGPRVIRIDPRKMPTPGPPWSGAQLEQVIEEICRFIEEAKRRHLRGYKVDVGEYLFVHVYHSDPALLSSRDPGKSGSINGIARGVGIPYHVLRYWIIAAAARHMLRELGFESSRLDLSDFASLYRLRDRPRLLEQLARLVHEKNISVEELKRRVSEALGRKTRRRKKDGAGRRRPRPRDELAVVRVLQVMSRWVETVELGAAQRGRAVAMLRDLRALVLAQESRS